MATNLDERSQKGSPGDVDHVKCGRDEIDQFGHGYLLKRAAWLRFTWRPRWSSFTGIYAVRAVIWHASRNNLEIGHVPE